MGGASVAPHTARALPRLAPVGRAARALRPELVRRAAPGSVPVSPPFLFTAAMRTAAASQLAAGARAE